MYFKHQFEKIQFKMVDPIEIEKLNWWTNGPECIKNIHSNVDIAIQKRKGAISMRTVDSRNVSSKD